MKFLKKYWWVFALILAAVLVYVFVFKKDESIAPKKIVSKCPQFDAEVKATEARIDASQGWKDNILAQTRQEGHPYYGLSYPEARFRNAVWTLKNDGDMPQDTVCY